MWRFVHLADPHLGALSDTKRNNRVMCTLMPEIIQCLRHDLHVLNPDFVLTAGDIANDRSRDSIYAARDLLDSLKLRYYPLGGNYDFSHENSRQWFVEAFHAHLPAADTVYSFTRRNLHFCILDPWWVLSDGGLSPFPLRDDPTQAWAVPPHQLAWLEEDLQRHAPMTSVIALHYPVMPLPRRLNGPSRVNAGSLTNGEVVLEVLARHPQVRLVLAGHLHLNFICECRGVVQVVTSALPEYPAEYRDIQVYEDRIEIHTVGLSDAAYAAQSLLDGGEWTAGEEQDRSTVVPLA